MMMQLLKNVKNRTEQNMKVQAAKKTFLNNKIMTENGQAQRVRRFKRGMMVWVDGEPESR